MIVRHKTLATIALAALALTLLGGAELWSYRAPLVGWAVTRLIERQGFGPVQLTVDNIGPHGLDAHDILLRDGAVRISAVSTSFAPLDLLRARIRRVELAGVEATLVAGRDGVELGGVPLGRDAAGGGGPPLVGWRIDALELPGARVSLEGASGPMDATFSATLVVANDEIKASSIQAEVRTPVAGTMRAAFITAHELALRSDATGTMRLVVRQAALTPEGLPWSAQSIEGEVAWHSDRSAAHLQIGRVVDRQQPMLVAPFSLATDASLVGPLLEVTAAATFDGKPEVRLEAKARHDRSSSSGSATLMLGPVVFHHGSLQPADLLPALGDMVEEIDGTIAVEGSAHWSGHALSPNLRLRLKDLTFVTSAAQFRAVNGEIDFTKLWPPATAPGQRLSGIIEAAGLPSAAFRLKGQLTAAPAIKLEQAMADVAGGEIAAMPFTIDPAARHLDTALQIDHVELSDVTKFLSLEGLSGTGQLDGQIPLHIEDGTLVIRDGRLATRGPGLLRYKPAKLPQEISAGGKPIELLLEALTDFHYETLALELEKSASGQGSILLHINGSNPAVLAGRAFVLNIRIESNFDRLAAYALLTVNSAQDMLRRAARRTGP